MRESCQMTVEIESTIGDACETYTMTLPARIEVTGDAYTLRFCEERDCGHVWTTLAWKRGEARVTMTSRGGVRCRMVFDTREVCMTRYEVAPLAFDLTVRSQEVLAELDENGGRISLVYIRELAGEEDRVSYRLTAHPHEEGDA